jgi:NADH:ubiquinone oxidoreductase subunit E
VDELQEEQLRDILSYYKGKKGELIPIMLEAQANFGYLPAEAIELIADFLNVAKGQIYSVASFYARLRLLPLGRQRITVCRGTACHIRGATQILHEMENTTGLNEGQTSDDLEYTLETAACLGCCALAPCITINSAVHGEMTPDKVRQLFPASGEGEQDV